MNRTLVQYVLRHTDVEGGDPDLLRRFVASADEPAFTVLVKRHGPMVWAACRHLIPNRADAEDAFQAVFLALARSARSIRKPEQLASWLHGAAVRIAGKAKRGFLRRKTHEQRTAKPEADSPVAAGAWDDMLAAVHDEVAKLPRSLRAAFVLCDLEGVDPTDAAARLGVKVNTLSGQLARARQRLLDTLTTRGLGAGLATIGTAVAVPQALADQAAGVLGTTPSTSVIELATEVTAMKLTNLKLLAAGLMVTCGLTLTGLGVWPKAEAQPPPGGGAAGGPPGLGAPPAGGPPGGTFPGGAGLGGPPGGLGGAGVSGSPAGGGLGGSPTGSPDGGMAGMGSGPARPSAAFEYLFVGKPTRRGALADIADLLRKKAEQGWEYTGPLDVDRDEAPRGKEFEGVTPDTRVVLVFKRATRPVPGGMGMPGGMGTGMSGAAGGPSAPMSGFGGAGSGTPGGYGAGAGGASPPRGGVAGARPGPGGTGSGDGDGGVPGTGAGTAPGKGAEAYQVFPLKNVTASDAASALSEVFNGPKADPEKARVRIVVEHTSNSIIVTRASVADLDTIRKLLEKVIDAGPADKKRPAAGGLGTGSPDGGEGGLGGTGAGGAAPGKAADVTLVYKLRHATATADLVGLVRTHYADARGQKTSAGLAVAADAKSNSIIVSGSQGTVDLARGIIDALDEKPKADKK